MLSFERRHQPLLPRRAFFSRLLRYGGGSVMVLLLWWALGAWGYHEWAGLPGLDAWLNAAMIVGGMGPVAEMETDAAKIFASLYAVISGTGVLTLMGVAFAPVLHRLLHKFHLEEDDTTNGR